MLCEQLHFIPLRDGLASAYGVEITIMATKKSHARRGKRGEFKANPHPPKGSTPESAGDAPDITATSWFAAWYKRMSNAGAHKVALMQDCFDSDEWVKADLEWFAESPERLLRLRRASPAELALLPPEHPCPELVTHVVVRLIAPGRGAWSYLACTDGGELFDSLPDSDSAAWAVINVWETKGTNGRRADIFAAIADYSPGVETFQ